MTDRDPPPPPPPRPPPVGDGGGSKEKGLLKKLFTHTKHHSTAGGSDAGNAGGGGGGGGGGWGLHFHSHNQHRQHHHHHHHGNHHALPFLPALQSPLGHSAPVFSAAAVGGETPRLAPITRATAEAVMGAIDYLGATALEVEGLYRVSGSKVDVERLQRLLEVGTSTTDALEAQDKHVIAGAIKKVLQEHEPLLPYGMFNAFLAVPRSDADGQATSAQERARAYQGLLAVLPPVSRALLGHLLLHLKRVAGRSDSNKMTASNLSITVGVNLLRPSESVESVTLQRLERARAVVTDLICLAEALFGGENVGASPPAALPPPPPPPPQRPPPVPSVFEERGVADDDRIDGPAIRFFNLHQAVSSGGGGGSSGDGFLRPSAAAAPAAAGPRPGPPKPPRQAASAAAPSVHALESRLDAVVTLTRIHSPPATED